MVEETDGRELYPDGGVNDTPQGPAEERPKEGGPKKSELGGQRGRSVAEDLGPAASKEEGDVMSASEPEGTSSPERKGKSEPEKSEVVEPSGESGITDEEESRGSRALSETSPPQRESDVPPSHVKTEEQCKAEVPTTDEDLRKVIIERTLQFLEDQTAQTPQGNEEDIWFTWGAWQLWKEQLEQLEKALTEEEKQTYRDRLDRIKKNIDAAQASLKSSLGEKVRAVVDEGIQKKLDEMASKVTQLHEKMLQKKLEKVASDIEKNIKQLHEEIKGVVSKVEGIEKQAGSEAERRIKAWWNEVGPQIDAGVRQTTEAQKHVGQARGQWRNAAKPQEKGLENTARKSKKKGVGSDVVWIIIALIIVIALVVGGGYFARGWLFGSKREGNHPTPASVASPALTASLPTPATTAPPTLTPTPVPPTSTPTPTPLPTLTVDRVAAVLASGQAVPTETPPSNVNASHGTLSFTPATVGAKPSPSMEEQNNVLGPYHIVEQIEGDDPTAWRMTPNGGEHVQGITSGNYLTPHVKVEGAYYLCSALAPEKEPQEGWGVTVRWKNKDKKIRAFLRLPGKDEITCTRVSTPWAVWNVNFIGEKQTKEARLDLTAYQWWLIPIAPSTPAGNGG